MSLPRDILDQLLSGYLDDALSNDERTRVEQLLRDDPQVARELQELRDLRDTLRQIHQEDQALHLGPNFADRVLKATVDQASAEGLSEGHPVMLLTQQPSTVVHRAKFPFAKVAGVVATLAASILVAIAVFRPPADNPQPGVLAQNDPPRVDPVPAAVPNPEKVIEQEAPVQPGPVEQLADNDTSNVPSPVEVPDPVEMPADADNSNNKITIPQNADSIAEARPEPNLNKFKDKVLPVMVVDVRQSEEGRQNNAVGLAMAKSGIKPADEKQINHNIVGIQKNLVKEDSGVSVLYFMASGKKIDNFINSMVADLDNFQMVGFSLTLDAPILNIAKRLNPKKVRHTWNLTDDSGNSLQLLVQELGNQKLNFPDRDQPLPKKSEGQDFTIPIFVMVR